MSRKNQLKDFLLPSAECLLPHVVILLEEHAPYVADLWAVAFPPTARQWHFFIIQCGIMKNLFTSLFLERNFFTECIESCIENRKSVYVKCLRFFSGIRVLQIMSMRFRNIQSFRISSSMLFNIWRVLKSCVVIQSDRFSVIFCGERSNAKIKRWRVEGGAAPYGAALF